MAGYGIVFVTVIQKQTTGDHQFLWDGRDFKEMVVSGGFK